MHLDHLGAAVLMVLAGLARAIDPQECIAQQIEQRILLPHETAAQLLSAILLLCDVPATDEDHFWAANIDAVRDKVLRQRTREEEASGHDWWRDVRRQAERADRQRLDEKVKQVEQAHRQLDRVVQGDLWQRVAPAWSARPKPRPLALLRAVGGGWWRQLQHGSRGAAAAAAAAERAWKADEAFR
ncbi:MAG: hypothetical protein M1826_000282 [Phylliscum demangeonii]|nr:MAG: hypothetical protein M1826_000282 [Phylliscum demangeonii]